MSRPLILCIAVWGEWHMRVFLEHALPALQAPGNLPDVDCILWIHTTKEDAPRLAKALPQANIACDLPATGTPVGKHAAIWAADTRRVVDVGAPLVLLPPDIIWTEGTLAVFQRRMDEGAGAIFVHCPRTLYDEATFPRGTRWTNDAAANVAMRFEHRLGRQYRYHGANFPLHAETVIWDVLMAGLLTRTLFSAPAVIDTRQFSLTRINQLAEDKPDAIYVVTDSDEMVGLSLAPDNYYADLDMSGGPLDPAKVRHHLVRWSVPTSRAMAQHSYRLHYGPVDVQRWAAAESEADAAVTRIFEGIDIARDQAARAAQEAAARPVRRAAVR